MNPNAAIHDDSGCFVPEGQPEISWWSEAKPPDRRTKANRPEGCGGTSDLRRLRRPDRGECPAFAGSRWFRSFLTPPPANFFSALRASIPAFGMKVSELICIVALLTGDAVFAESNSGYQVPPEFTPLRLGEVKPAGWLRDWCQSAADGITGHSDELDPLFARGWMDADIVAQGTGAQSGDKMVGYALEQAGYWVDGAVRLAHLLDDEALLAKCRLRFDTVLKRVEAGEPPVPRTELWFKGEKWGHWPMAIMGRAMLAEYSFTGDARYLRALEKIYADYPKYNEGKKFSLIHHQGRQLMNVEVMFEAARLGGDVRLRDDALKVLGQQSEEIKTRLGWHEKGIATGKTDEHFYSVPFGHAVTLNETAKIPAIGYLYSGNAEWLRFSEAYFDDVEKNEMMPYGLTSAHEHLGGIGPFSCSELCNAVDYSWSAIWMMRITGRAVYGDRVERAMFNAAPGGIAPDFKSHQYFLSSNRIDDKHPAKPKVGGNSSFEAKQFPLCCTGNMSRLLPDYVMHLWMLSRDGGLAATLYGPSEVKTTVANVKIALATRTDYPFRNDINVVLKPAKPVTFPLYLRVPAWCDKPVLALNEKPQPVDVQGGFIRIEREWKTGDEVRVTFPTQPRIVTGICAGGEPFASVLYGPLLFALPIPIEGNDLNKPRSGVEWQFALSPESKMTVETRPMPEKWTWQAVPVRIEVPAVPAKFDDFSLPRQPVENASPSVRLTLVPIGTTAFRVSMFGVAK